MKQIFQNSKGSSQIFIIIVVILIAILLAGGELFLGNAFPIPDFLGIGENGKTGGNGGNGASNNPSTWSVDLQNKGCLGTVGVVTATATGLAKGYVSIEVSNGAGGFAVVETQEFKNLPTSVYELNLPNELGFNNSPWRVRLFEGGTLSGTEYRDGTEKAVKDGAPTGC